MYENESDHTGACFDPNNIPDGPAVSTAIPTNTTTTNDVIYPFYEPTTNTQIPIQDSDSSNPGNHLIPNGTSSTDTSTAWVGVGPTHMLGGFSTHFDENTLQPTTDLLTLLHLPRCSFGSSVNNNGNSNSNSIAQSLSFGKPPLSPPLPTPASLSFLGELNNPAMMVDNPSGSYDPTNGGIIGGPLSYDPLFHLNLPPQPSPLLRDLMFVPHHGYGNGKGYNGDNINIGNGNGNGNGNSSSLFGSLDDGEGNHNSFNGIYQDSDHHNIHGNGIFEFSKGDGKGGKCPKNFVTERQRRQNFNDKYQLLRSLVPNQTKGDRASIVYDAINHINELRRTVGELKLLVEKKRMSKERLKRQKTDQDTPSGGAGGGGGENHSNAVDGSSAAAVVKPDPDEDFNGSTAIQLRSSWIQRKCKDTEVDVRIVDDDVTIKLVQRKKINCLLSVSRTLDELQLDLRHVAGGHVGDYYSYLFNSKICEGSSVYASAIANKLIEIVERQYAAASVAVGPTTSF